MTSTKRLPVSKPGAPTGYDEPDWAALDALTDEIAAQAASNPDAAPVGLDWSLDNPKVRVTEPVDVKAIREKLGMSQNQFADAIGVSLAAVRDWEQRRRVPRGPARSLLRIIDSEPEAVRRALSKAA